jgi:hypothetical protein
MPHEATGEKPSFLLFGMDLRTPSEAAILPATPSVIKTIEKNTSARELAARSIQRS